MLTVSLWNSGARTLVVSMFWGFSGVNGIRSLICGPHCLISRGIKLWDEVHLVCVEPQACMILVVCCGFIWDECQICWLPQPSAFVAQLQRDRKVGDLAGHARHRLSWLMCTSRQGGNHLALNAFDASFANFESIFGCKKIIDSWQAV